MHLVNVHQQKQLPTQVQTMYLIWIYLRLSFKTYSIFP